MSGQELYKKYRPQSLKTVFGQESAVKQMKGMIDKKSIPHTTLFTGPSGCGKTTLARILAKELGIDPHDVSEINAANSKGIDMVRDITNQLGFRPLKSNAKMYIIDEAQQLTAAAQDSFLKPLEDTPSHVYFAICTTDASRLKATIKTRCTEIAVASMSNKHLEDMISYVCKKEKMTIDEDVVTKLVNVSVGSARKALVLLHQIRDLSSQEEQMECLFKQDAESAAIDLCRALFDTRNKWADVAAILRNVQQDPEAVRRSVLGYASSILLKSDHKRAALVLESFELNVFDSGKAGLVLRAYNCFSTR
jgi:DNA polymerase III gamma/tau subunit